MRGSVRRRGAGWEYLYREVEPTTGKATRLRSKGGFPTRTAAEVALRAVLASVDGGHYVSPTQLTLTDFIENQWLPAIVPTIRPSTHYSYARNLRLHILPTLGGRLLQSLDAPAINRLYADLLRAGRQDGTPGGLAPRTVRYVHCILHRALKDAVRWQLIARNVVDLADPPRQSAVLRPESTTWTSTNVSEFLTQLRDDRLYAAWLLLATTGMRRGEVLGLRWADVDFALSKLAVRQTLVAVAHAPEYGSPKTTKGRRVVALDEGTLAALKAHRAKQAAERLAAGEAWVDLGLVFTYDDGRAMHPERFSREFTRRVERLGFPRIRLHDLRHTWATLALEAGVHPKVVSERLGHSNISITLDTYSHVSPVMHADAARLVASLVLPP